MSLLILDGEVDGRPGVDVRIEGARIAAVAPELTPSADDEILDAAGGAVIPGLHDHHVHLRALAAAAASVAVGPPTVTDAAGFRAAIRAASAVRPPGMWLRCVGYHESVAGPLDATALDAVVADRPLRVQHRSGALWVFNSHALGLTRVASCPGEGVERDRAGRPTGRLWRMDEWLRSVVPPLELDLVAVGRAAMARGVTGFTDADPDRDFDDAAALAVLPQRLHLMGPVGLCLPSDPRITLGPVKVVLDDVTLPSPAELADVARAAHAEGRPIAVHCVTRSQLLLAMIALGDAGPAAGDRIEHGAVIPDEVVDDLRRLDITVVTQPGFVAERGAQYVAEVEEDDRPLLYRCGSLLRAGVKVAASTDAPFGDADPWRAIGAAVDRRTLEGVVVGPRERVDPSVALRLFLGAAHTPAVPRRIEAGAPADVCVLNTPLAVELVKPAKAVVRATIVAGITVYDANRP